MKGVISIEYQSNAIVWPKSRHPRHFLQNLLGMKVHASCKILKFCRHLGATRIHVGQFSEFHFCCLKRQSYRYCQEKKGSPAHIIFIHKSYKEIIDKIIRQPKHRTNLKFYISGKPYFSFASDRLFIFSVFIVLNKMMRINKNKNFGFYEKSIMVS